PVGVEVVQDQHDALGLGKAHVDQLLDVLGPVALGALGGDLGLALPAERLTAQEQIPHALVFVLVSPSASAAPVRAGIPAACRAATACSSRPDRPAGGAGRRGG